jgi:hypothetical protein
MREMTHTWALRVSAAACLLMACAPDSDPEILDAYVPPAAGPDAGGPAPSNPAVPGAAQGNDSGVPTETSDAGAAVSDASSADATAPTSQTLLPFFPGATWTYRVTSATGTTMKVTTVGPEEAVGGTGPNAAKRAFKVTTTKGASDKTVSWQAVEGESVIRYREVSYAAMTGMPELEEHWVPSKIHVHSSAMRRAASAKWSETYQETKAMVGMPVVMASVTDNWTVDAPKVPVTVPAGTFDAVVLIKSTASGSKTYWYVPGVGKVKETGGQTEELLSYDVTP